MIEVIMQTKQPTASTTMTTYTTKCRLRWFIKMTATMMQQTWTFNGLSICVSMCCGCLCMSVVGPSITHVSFLDAGAFVIIWLQTHFSAYVVNSCFFCASFFAFGFFYYAIFATSSRSLAINSTHSLYFSYTRNPNIFAYIFLGDLFFFQIYIFFSSPVSFYYFI